MKRNQNRFTDILIVVIISCFIGMVSGAAAIISINNEKSKKRLRLLCEKLVCGEWSGFLDFAGYSGG